MSKLNRTNALVRLGGNEEMYNRMIETLRRKFGSFSKSEFDIMNSDREKFYITIHSLKNLAASLGAEDLETSAIQLETELKNGASITLEKLFFICIDELDFIFNEIGREDKSEDTLFHRKEIDNKETISLLNEIKKYIESYSPGEARKAVRTIIQHKWPSVIAENMNRLSEMLKEYDFSEAEDLFETITKKYG